jgi:sugar lactone lactonase YvrE
LSEAALSGKVDGAADGAEAPDDAGAPMAATTGKRWDVFFSYASPDRDPVEKLALHLENVAGLRVFLDKWRLVPGEPFIPELREAIRESRSCAVFIGPSGTRPWQNREVEAALSQAVDKASTSGEWPFRVIPVLLPGATAPAGDDLPAFLDLQTWVDFRTPLGLDDPDTLHRLMAGVRGVEPGKPDLPPRWLTTVATLPGARPTGVAVSAGVLFVADHVAGQVLRIENDRVVQRRDGLAKPHHLIVMDDELLVADTNHHRLARFDLQLAPRDGAAAPDTLGLRRPHGLTSNLPGEFFVTDADNHRVLRVHNGAVVASAGRTPCESGSGPGEFAIPCGVAASLDCVLVADTFNHRIQVLRRDLTFISSFGELGYGKGQMAYPVGVATWHHWIVVADEHNKRLQLWRREGQALPFDVRCVSENLLGRHLGSPFGVCFDEDGALFVADRRRGAVLRIDFGAMLADLALPPRDC